MKENISEKERFFSKVSHDLRGSFTSILGFGDILNDPNEILTSEEKSEFTNRISKQSRDTYDLLVNFVNWLKLENYDYGLTSEKIELLNILLEIKTIHQKKISQKNVSINISIDDSDFVVMDYGILNSIINNIFVFLTKICCENSNINVNSSDCISKYTCIEVSVNFNESESSFLQNINLGDLNNELSFPIIFAIKFTEQSGGAFNLSIDQGNKLIIAIKLPKE